MSVVVPALVVSDALPDSPEMEPPVELIAPVSDPLVSVPPARAMLLIVCAKPPRSSVPPALTAVAVPALKALTLLAVSVPPETVVDPV